MIVSGNLAQLPQARQSSKHLREEDLLETSRVLLPNTSSSTKMSEPLAVTPEDTKVLVLKDLTTQQRARTSLSPVSYADICQLQLQCKK